MVSPSTFSLIARAVDAWRDTGGRYDPTVLAALEAAGYDRDFDAVARAGDDGRRDRPSRVPGCGDVELDSLVSAVRLPVGVALDLGGIGKGYAADEVSAELLDAGVPGVTGVLVNLGGDLRARGDAPQPHGWVVDVDDPLATGRTGLLAFAEGAIATSTKLRRAWTRGGRTLHHLIDPRTGEPAESGLASVTVVAGEAWRAEVLAKAAFVAGPDDGRALIEAPGPPACSSPTTATSWSSTGSPASVRDYASRETSGTARGDGHGRAPTTATTAGTCRSTTRSRRSASTASSGSPPASASSGSSASRRASPATSPPATPSGSTTSG